MPLLIKHLDAIAREKNRDVLSITFHDPEDFFTNFDFERDLRRKKIIKFLDDNNISYEPCAGFSDECSISGSNGQLYVDVPFDEQDEKYQLVRNLLENEDGSMRYKNVTFWLLKLERALTNQHHDDPGYYEKWAENF